MQKTPLHPHAKNPSPPQVVTTTLPFSEGLDDCSHGFIMSSYILLAHIWAHAAPKDVALRVITSTDHHLYRAGSVCLWLSAARACMTYAS